MHIFLIIREHNQYLTTEPDFIYEQLTHRWALKFFKNDNN